MDIGHIFERGVIHFFSSAGVYLCALFGFWALERKVRWWPDLKGWGELVVPAFFSFLFISNREVFDVAAGGSVIKSVCDWISWILGLGMSVWALYRIAPRLGQILGEIHDE